MAHIIEMPKLSDTMEEGGISEWFKNEGDFVEEGEPLLAIETDKATMEFVSPEEGTILKILVKPGENVPLMKPIAVIGEKGEKFDLSQLSQGSAKDKQQDNDEPQTTVEQTPSASSDQELELNPPSDVKFDRNERIKASPLAKKIAKDRGINLQHVQGTGPNGRIIKRDLDQTVSKEVSFPSPTNQISSPSEEDQKIPLSMMRKTIAKRLLAGKNNAPHFYLTVSVDMSAAIAWRTKLNERLLSLDSNAKKVSVNDIIILATAKALKRHPEINSSWHDDYIMQHANIDISMAVSLPTGLITPVIRNADQLGVVDIAKASKHLAQQARDGQLKPEDYSNGTFTISNLGMTQIEEFTAIINPPQACILAVGQTKQTVQVNEAGEFFAQPRMKMTMSCDHRVVDGMVGAKFLETLISLLEQPLLMLS